MTATEDDGGRVNEIRDGKNYRCRTYTPLITMAVGSMTSATGPCEIVINYANDLWEIHESPVEAHLSAGRKTR